MKYKPNQEIKSLLEIAQHWREWEEKQITGANDDFLLKEFEEKLEDWLLPWLKKVTEDDNQYNYFGSKIWNEVIILTLEIRKAALERQIKENSCQKTISREPGESVLAHMIRSLKEFVSYWK